MLDTLQLLLDGDLGAGIAHSALKEYTLRGPEDQYQVLLSLSSVS